MHVHFILTSNFMYFTHKTCTWIFDLQYEQRNKDNEILKNFSNVYVTNHEWKHILTSINVTNNRHTIKIFGCKKIFGLVTGCRLFIEGTRFDPSFRPSMRNPTCSFACCKENIWPDQAPPWFSFSLFHSCASHPASTCPTRRRRFSMIAQKPFRRTHRENGEQITAPPRRRRSLY